MHPDKFFKGYRIYSGLHTVSTSSVRYLCVQLVELSGWTIPAANISAPA